MVQSPANETLNLALARPAARVILQFEQFRLGLYRARTGTPDEIHTRRIGAAWCLRFPSVGYFNQVQGLGDTEADRLDEIESLYADLEQGYKVQVAPDADRMAIFQRLARRGFTVEARSVRLVHSRPRPAVIPHLPGLTLAPLQAHEVDEFFHLYLDCFGADPRGRADAVANMRLLAGQPSLHCLLARVDGQAAGLGMLFLSEGVAYFCAGAVRPAWQRSGLHAILLNERLRLAAETGCELAVSWTEEGSVSHRNLTRAGFTLAYRDPIWASPSRARFVNPQSRVN